MIKVQLPPTSSEASLSRTDLEVHFLRSQSFFIKKIDLLAKIKQLVKVMYKTYLKGVKHNRENVRK